MGQWFQRFLAGGMLDEVSDATIQGYLRSASQIEDVWQQIDEQVDELILQGMAPWDAYARLGYALAFIRACRTNTVLVQELIRAAATAKGPGHLARITYEQALALCQNIEPYMEEAIKASTQPNYTPSAAFPLELGPRIRYADPNIPLPLPHLQGMIWAAQQMHDWAAGLLAKYELALSGTTLPVPAPVSTHVEEVKSELKLGDFHIRTGSDMVGQISTGQVPAALSTKAEGFIWEAMESFFKVSQLVADPQALVQPSSSVPDSTSQAQPQQSDPVPPDTVSQPASEVSDVPNPVIVVPEAAPQAPPQPSPDLSDLFGQITGNVHSNQARPSQGTSTHVPPVTKHKQEPEKSSKQDIDKSMMDMFSDITGEK